MDILNFISWIRNRRYFSTVDPATTLLPVGIRDEKRDDKYLAGAITMQELIDEVVPLVPPTPTGLFSQTANSAVVTGTVETTLIDGGVGTLSVPANGFQVGDSFRVVMNGVMNAANNEDLRLRVKANTVVLLDSNLQGLGSSIINDKWTLYVDFTVRQIGAATVAEIASSGAFTYLKTNNGTLEGFGFSTINNTTFDTTISNTLDITAEWGSNDPGNTIYSEVFTLTKTY